ncbi:PEP-CTERM sorting domain-containing protein [Roseomonas sp. NAR14]|uniref:PEP-CTERM sorting domain-containing protein n=1 Tax=Roseomonas acroporae TaxID=2937791 RepID=A0A9X1YGN7_9PROT|nr:PEP-CTERM sorting domain-containing protein [Roseomonas acroporae]MCK8785926.1 PEP-CTERM sorting domain-containing protein [Roseomonas acroporae]
MPRRGHPDLPRPAALALAAALATGALLAAGAPPARAQEAGRVQRIEEAQFRAGAGRITFGELPAHTPNPVYPPALYGGGPGSPTVRFGGFFQGRRMGRPEECPPGAVPTGCLAGRPSAPLTLDPAAPAALTLIDRSRPEEAPQLGGTPVFNGPVAIWFDADQAAVGLEGGVFDAIGSVAITIYDRQGQALGRVTNRRLGAEFLGLATADLVPRIAGLEFHLVGAEQGGFGVDNIRFGAPSQVELPDVTPPPAPSPRRAPILP